MAVAPTFVSKTESAWTTTATPKTVSVTVQTGDLIVVGAMSENSYSTLGITGGSLTWTQQQSVSSSGYGDVIVWTTQALSNTTLSVTVSNSGPGLVQYGLVAVVYRNHAGVGNSVQDTSVSSDADHDLTVSANSAVCVFVSDYDAESTSGRAYYSVNGTPTEMAVGQSAAYAWYAFRYNDVGTAGTKHFGLTDPSTRNSLVMLEILGTATGISATYSNPTTIASAEAIGSPSVNYGPAYTTPTTIPSGEAFGQPVIAVDTWRQIIDRPSWINAVTAHQRTIGYRAEMIDVDDNHIMDVPMTGGTIDFDGEAAEQWACQLTIPGQEWVAHAPTDPLDPRSGMRCRIWWRLLINGGWVEVPVGTFVLEDPRITDNGAMPSTSIRGRDPLTIIRRAGYGSLVIPVGGLTVPEALARIMLRVAPATPFRIDSSSTVTLPTTYELTGLDPLDDMTNIAAQADLKIRTDREGKVVAAPQPTPRVLRADWQEGPDCPVTDLNRDVNTSQMLNSVTIVSTSPEVIPPISATVEDDDQSSPTWVGGVWGRRAITIRTDSVATQAGAESMARGILNGRRRPQEEISIEVPPRGDLGYRDLVALKREMSGVANTYRIATWTLTFGNAREAPATMPVKMISRTLI